MILDFVDIFDDHTIMISQALIGFEMKKILKKEHPDFKREKQGETINM